jgi:hypothetical protein
MKLQKASRQRVKIKMALQGPSGAGKTYSALLLAFGLCGNWSKVCVIDTENRSSELYAHLGDYFVAPIAPPFAPEKYIDAIKACENEGIEVIIIESVSHEWEGIGGILEQHSQMTGNSYVNWNKLTPRHNSFVQTILQSPCHVIGTIRSKQEYVLNEKNGKMVPEKLGMKGVTREGMDYEFTLVLEIDIKNHVTATKDRTSLFLNKPSFVITPETGKIILDWCNTGVEVSDERAEVLQRINGCKAISELLSLYNLYPSYQMTLKQEFANKRQELEPISNQSNLIVKQFKPISNGRG